MIDIVESSWENLEQFLGKLDPGANKKQNRIIKKESSLVFNQTCITHHHHHHHLVLVARISLTLSRHSSLSFIASGRSSRLHPVSSHSCCMYVRDCRPAFARSYAGVWVSEWVRERERESVCVCVYERERVCVCGWVFWRSSVKKQFEKKYIKKDRTPRVYGPKMKII